MKYFLKVATPAFLIIFLAISCNKDKEDTQVTSENIPDIQDRMNSGLWSITSYRNGNSDNGDINRTSDYIGFKFNFKESGILDATNGDTVVQGDWFLNDSDGYDDHVHFNIAFTTPESLEELSQDWDIEKYSDSSIELEGRNTDSSGNAYLILEKL